MDRPDSSMSDGGMDEGEDLAMDMRKPGD